MTTKFMHLFCKIWDKGQVPQEYKDTSVIHLYKGKGNKSCCYNDCGISLLSIAGKILARAILNRIIHFLVEIIYPESVLISCWTGHHWWCLDWQVLEKAREQNQHLDMVFVDLTGAFDTEPWCCMESAAEVWLPREVCQLNTYLPWRNDSQCHGKQEEPFPD